MEEEGDSTAFRTKKKRLMISSDDETGMEAVPAKVVKERVARDRDPPKSKPDVHQKPKVAPKEIPPFKPPQQTTTKVSTDTAKDGKLSSSKAPQAAGHAPANGVKAHKEEKKHDNGNGTDKGKTVARPASAAPKTKEPAKQEAAKPEPDKKKKTTEKPKSAEKKTGGDERGALKPKKSVVIDILRRWWYCLPEWPPKDFDYEPELKKRNLRKVDLLAWKMEPTVDKNGLEKVFELAGFPGAFKNARGEMIDLRPRDSCPCMALLMKKGLKELYGLLVKGLEAQIEALKEAEPGNRELQRDLSEQLTAARKQLDIHSRKES